MHLYYVGCAAAFLAVAPAFAQDNAAANTSNAVQANEVAANTMSATPPGPATAAAAPGNQAAPPPETTPAPADQGSVVVRKNKSFPWGVLGVLGLIGLFGRWRSAS